MSERKPSVIIKEPGRKPRHVNISTSLKNLQNTVGGYIETVTIEPGWTIICNEDGRYMGLQPNCMLEGIAFVGTIILIGTQGDELCDLQISFAAAKERWPELWG